MMMVAAPDTTSALICSFVNQVIQHPDVHDRLLSELVAAEAAGELTYPVASFAQIRSLPFFTACIQESARLFPSIPVLLPRRVPQSGLVLKGFLLPEGTAIGASAVVVNRNIDVFGADAAIFRPERWLEESPKVAQMHKHIFSWGFGSRKCVGINLALLETYKFCFQVRIPVRQILVGTLSNYTFPPPAISCIRHDVRESGEALEEARRYRLCNL